MLTWTVRASDIHPSGFIAPLTADTVPKKPRNTRTNPPDTSRPDTSRRPALRNSTDTSGRDSLITSDTTILSTDTFSLRISKDSFAAPVTYEAEDSAVILVPEKKVILYGNTKTKYQDVNLQAPVVILDQKASVLTAVGTKDSLGESLVRAVMTEKENKFQSDTIRYNFKTQRGLTYNTFTNQNEIFINAGLAKKVDSNTVFMKGARFTTCDLDDPHFAFRANKLKVINQKVAVSGPMHPEFEGVPVPVYLPFGFYPLTRGRKSGMLAPQFVATDQQGLGLQGIGYYKILNDYIDATFRADIYSYGGWKGDLTSTYRKRYRYTGTVNLSFQNTKINFKGDPDFRSDRTFLIAWSHSTDQRARPGVTFNASVNASSAKYNQYLTTNTLRNFQNKQQSSISYSKNWIGKPFSLQLAANHNQDNITRLINVSLPNASFTVNQIFPFQRKEALGAARWYEKIGVGYSGQLQNQFSFYDSAFNAKRLLDTLLWGATHNIPIALSLPPVGPLIVTPSISYQQQWIMSRTEYTWNPVTDTLDAVTTKGFHTAHQMSVGLGFGTNVFGTFNFKRSKILAIRHAVRPSFSFSYSPNLAKNYYKTVQYNRAGEKRVYSVYQNNSNIYSGYSNVEFGGIGFGVDNSLEMKVRATTDSGAAESKKIRLIDGFGFTSGYNFLLDSFQLNTFSLYLRSSLFDKVNLNFTADLDPYEVNNFGRRVNTVSFGRGRLGRVTRGNLSLSTSFRSKPRDESQGDQTVAVDQNRITDPTLLADQSRLQDYMRRNPREFVNFNIPYDFGVDLAMGFSRNWTEDGKVVTDFNSSVNLHGSFSLTPKWNFSAQAFYDLKTKTLGAFALSINRDMHCWQMAISVSPIGLQRFFTITISPKSSLLQNLRVNRTRVFNDF
ncbi:putative LPS assembly protein LptD [Flaviaesturariibacter amylovorans]|uniref:putative LPS assembly protein LptD n=1 Tax=Flaviaesturariibacter amylovorans TaxID=1084520 RepID=UPI0031EF4AB7